MCCCLEVVALADLVAVEQLDLQELQLTAEEVAAAQAEPSFIFLPICLARLKQLR